MTENYNKWIPVEKCYPPNGHDVEVLIENKIVNVKFIDTDDYRSWQYHQHEYDGYVLPTHWRFKSNACAVIMKIDLENQVAEKISD